MKEMIFKGIIPINKPINWTSFDVVNKVKHTLRQIYGKNSPKVGHLGTLDPMATGVLLVTVGSATKLFDLMQQKTKTYVATFEFGYETDTLDATGEITNKSTNLPNIQQIEKVLPKFIGKISQIPPKYSAKSINGARAYDLARKGVEFELKPKLVEIFDIKIINFVKNVIKLEIICGSIRWGYRGRSLLQSVPSFQTVHRTVWKFTPCRALKRTAELCSAWDSVPYPARDPVS